MEQHFVTFWRGIRLRFEDRFWIPLPVALAVVVTFAIEFLLLGFHFPFIVVAN